MNNKDIKISELSDDELINRQAMIRQRISLVMNMSNDESVIEQFERMFDELEEEKMNRIYRERYKNVEPGVAIDTDAEPEQITAKKTKIEKEAKQKSKLDKSFVRTKSPQKP